MGQVVTNHQHDDDLLDPTFMRKLDRLDVLSRKILAGKLQGERRSKRKGRSVEFADYRPYTTGDDLRFVDWNLYARLDRLFLRLFVEEEDLSVSILIDTTASMDWGQPDKLWYAKRLAAALGYIGLVNHNRVHLYGFAGDLVDPMSNLRGQRLIPPMLHFVRSQPVRQAGNLDSALRRFTLTQRLKGVVILISDFLEKGDIAAALRYVAGDRYDVYAIQVLSPQEMDPGQAAMVGDLRLQDCEDEQMTQVSVTAALMKQYRANLQSFCGQVRQQCLRHGIAHTVTDTSVAFDKLVLGHLRARHLLG